MAAVDYFLKLDGIDGESQDDFHKGEIEVSSWSFGASNSSLSHGGGGGAGKVQMQDFHFVMDTSQASTALLLACATGKHIKEGILTVRKAGGEVHDEFWKWRFTDCIVSSYEIAGDASPSSATATPSPTPVGAAASGGGTGVPTESVSLNFAKIEWTYQRRLPDGTLAEAVRAGWDLKKGTKA